MSAFMIDRLILQVPGLSESDGRRLALQVAQGLGTAGSVGGGRDIPVVHLDLKAKPNTGVDELARQIVAELLQQLRRLP
jgi:hypothetical protein